MNSSLLLEIGTEELPPRALRGLSLAFADGVSNGLRDAGLAFDTASVYATPRRLAVLLRDVADRAPDQSIQRQGPAVTAAFDADGKPTKAAEGFARSCGVPVHALATQDTPKGERLVFNGTQTGETLADLLPDVVASALHALPIPKRMRWGRSEAAFVRPVHWVVALHGQNVMPLTLFDCSAGAKTRGHRFHHPAAIELARAEDYPDKLYQPGRVMADFEQRRETIRAQVQAAAAEMGGEAMLHETLLEEVTALVEWPVALAGRFEDRFLVLPREVLISTLESHQRYFPVTDPANGNLLPCFVTVANIDSPEPERIIAGNERVVRPRLADALFFREQDLARGLPAYAAELGRVSFQNKLGSLADKTQRIISLVEWLAAQTGVDAQSAKRAAQLCKADLLTEMVGEFPDLQGTMGRYYAEAAGEPATVAEAIEQHYAPGQAGAPIPASENGQLLAIADKLDTLTGIFALGKRPSGDKDPFALRRAALGVVRILIEAELEIDLTQAIAQALQLQPLAAAANTQDDLIAFHSERLRGYYSDRGIAAEIFEAVAANGLRTPVDFDRRLRAVHEFINESAAQQLSGAHKRIRNILKNQIDTYYSRPDLLVESAESDLHESLLQTRTVVEQLSRQGKYAQALLALAKLQSPVDRFFDQVMVMSDDAAIRDNRLALLGELDRVCRSVADISRLSS